MHPLPNPLVVIIMGVSGSGKSTVGKELSNKTDIPFFDGDDFHPQENIQKMAAGNPLNDTDRTGWLNAIHQFCMKRVRQKKSCIIACSALKESYREILKKDMETVVRFVFLQGDFETIKKRLSGRKMHFMPTALLQSQFETLQPPKNAITVDISQTSNQIVEEILKKL